MFGIVTARAYNLIGALVGGDLSTSGIGQIVNGLKIRIWIDRATSLPDQFHSVIVDWVM